MKSKLIPAAAVIGILGIISLSMKEYWYIVWIVSGMILLGYLRTSHLTQLSADLMNKEKEAEKK